MPRIKVIILGSCLLLASISTVYGSEDDIFGNCGDSPRGPADQSPKAVRAAKKEFRKQYGPKIPYCPNYFANVTNLILDQWELVAGANIGPQGQVNVFTEYSDPENDVVTFNYRVSGGRIIGQGARVVWDLAGLAAGTYMIMAGVNDGAGVCGEIKKRKVEILECAGCTLRETE